MTRRKDPPGTPSECRSCKAAIVWVVTERGRPMPCDLEPADDGRFFLFRRDDRIEAISINSDHASAVKARAANQRTHHSHFSTCPQRDEHRKPRSGA